MKTETERKYLVEPALFDLKGIPHRLIEAGYYHESKAACPVAIRVTMNSRGVARICFKVGSGLSRTEVERDIEIPEATELLRWAPGRILKVRYSWDGWDVDQFLNQHDGLWLAEYEDEKAPTELPGWIDREVTGNPQYENSYLAFNPTPNPHLFDDEIPF